MEIRDKVTEYVRQRILALRSEKEKEGSNSYQNVSAVRANTMKFMSNFFRGGQLEKLFFLFPDPHFKASNHRCGTVSFCCLSALYADAMLVCQYQY
jgi:tRNA (guanine-N7-)-methyltransferase